VVSDWDVEDVVMFSLFLTPGLRINAAMRLVCPTPSVTSRHFLDIVGDIPLRRVCTTPNSGVICGGGEGRQ